MRFSFDSDRVVAAGVGVIICAYVGLFFFKLDGVLCLSVGLFGAFVFGVGVFLAPYDLIIGGGK
ncbi:hypothetical protein GOV10_05330 [Candidatus Woesearchaeota archaeon]|nr:hypothetical protein [Candidatus Woesearchaeota archaeon]